MPVLHTAITYPLPQIQAYLITPRLPKGGWKHVSLPLYRLQVQIWKKHSLLCITPCVQNLSKTNWNLINAWPIIHLLKNMICSRDQTFEDRYLCCMQEKMKSFFLKRHGTVWLLNKNCKRPNWWRRRNRWRLWRTRWGMSTMNLARVSHFSKEGKNFTILQKPNLKRRKTIWTYYRSWEK